MIETLERSLFTAYDRAARLAREKQSRRGLDRLLMSASGGLGQLLGSDGSNLEMAAEQYRHFRGRVFAAVRVITQRIAGQPVFVARVVEPGTATRSVKSLLESGRIKPAELPGFVKQVGAERLDILEDHPLQRAIDDPNELMVRSTLFGMTIPSWLVTGRAFWLITENGGRREITPIPTTWVTPRNKDGRLRGEWDIRPAGSLDEPLVVPGEMLAHFYFPDPSNPLGCLSPLQMQARSVLADESIQAAQQVAFRNSINPHVALIAGEASTSEGKRQVKLTSAQRQQLTTWMKQEYQGVQKTGLPIVLDALIRDVKVLSHKPAEMAFMDSSALTKADIYEGFGVNPISAGQVEGANRASSAVADHHLCSNTVNPMIETMSQVMTKWVAPRFAKQNEKLRVWIAPCEPHDPELLLKKWEFAARQYCVDQNEIRTRLLGLPPWRTGDRVAMPGHVEFQPTPIRD
ncbi:MAG: phage portal protein [Planctomycetaceae bacterium]